MYMHTCEAPSVDEKALPIVRARATRATFAVAGGAGAACVATWSSDPAAVLVPSAFILGWLNLVGF